MSPGQPIDVLDPARMARLQAMARVSPNAGLLPHLIDLFVEDTATRLVALRSAVERHDDDAVRALAHGMRGGAATLGAVEVVERCAELEDLPAARWTWDRVTHRVQKLDRAFARARRALEVVTRAPPAVPATD